jgi:hypothetical protein
VDLLWDLATQNGTVGLLNTAKLLLGLHEEAVFGMVEHVLAALRCEAPGQPANSEIQDRSQSLVRKTKLVKSLNQQTTSFKDDQCHSIQYKTEYVSPIVLEKLWMFTPHES